MRIQHNIMAMSAYRNYTNNVSAMKKNLEKLSSGYKINRAGDDAAGLAISEKMRAQITGLETAQKNAKDGISLVQTAEGALTEVHDMLNRMVELASMSANGTYDNTTDRKQLQKEMDQLRSEINRIADSANFNGINLLDGSMQSGATVGVTNTTLSNSDLVSLLPDEVATDKNNEVGVIAGGTVVETNNVTAATANFEISLDGLADINTTSGGVFTLTIGKTAVTVALTSGSNTADKIATALVSAYGAGTSGVELFDSTFEITATGNKLTFTATDAGKVNLDAGAKVEWSWTADGDTTVKYADDGIMSMDMDGGPVVYADNGPTIGGTAGTAIQVKAGSGDGATAKYKVDLAGKDQSALDGKKIDGVALSWAAASASTITAGQVMTAFVSAYNADTSKNYTASVSGTNIVLTAKKEGAVSSAPQTDLGGSDADLTVVTAGKEETTKALTASASALDATELLAAVPSGTADGAKITIELNATSKKLDLKIGDKVIGSSAESVDGSRKEFTFTATSGGANLGKVTFSSNPAEADISTAIDTGLSYKEVSTPPTPSGSTAVTADIPAGTVSGMTTDYSTATSATTVAAGDGDKLTAYFKTGAGSSITVDGKKIDLTSVALADGDKITEKLAEQIGAAVKAELAKDTEYTYSDIKVKIGNDSPIAIHAAGNTPPIQITFTKTKKDGPDPEPGVDENAKHGVINSGLQNTDSGATAAVGMRANTRLDTSKVDGLWNDGSKITIGDKEVIIKNGENSSVTGENVIDVTDLTDDQKVQLLANTLNDGNTIFSVGHDGKNLTLQQLDPTKTEMRSREEIIKDGKISITTQKLKAGLDEAKTGKSLTLQIGDTADEWNQLKVDIRDTHCSSLGKLDENGNLVGDSLADIRIDDQDEAAKAIDVIKDAINTVSDIRGTLGATQNRLDHTINNLSVMTENIQDAESTIRDVDVAEEMMAYTKNNILIQSAQAMLAQANQVPQGVLQLLQ